jgi:hypothetical protein
MNGPYQTPTEDLGCECCGGDGVSLDIGVVVRAETREDSRKCSDRYHADKFAAEWKARKKG